MTSSIRRRTPSRLSDAGYYYCSRNSFRSVFPNWWIFFQVERRVRKLHFAFSFVLHFQQRLTWRKKWSFFTRKKRTNTHITDWRGNVPGKIIYTIHYTDCAALTFVLPFVNCWFTYRESQVSALNSGERRERKRHSPSTRRRTHWPVLRFPSRPDIRMY